MLSYYGAMGNKIEKILERVRPALNLHEGDIQFIRFDKRSGSVFVQLMGTCTHCAISDITLKHLILRELQREMPTIRSVETVGV